MPNLMPFDEINQLREELTYSTYSGDKGERRFLMPPEDIIQYALDLLIISYDNGIRDVEDMLGIQISPEDKKTIQGIIFAPIGGKTFEERIREYVDNPKNSGNATANIGKSEGISPAPDISSISNVEDIMKVIETESHRVYNASASNAAQRGGAKFKTYCTMKDDRVRDTHDYLEGNTKPLNEEFYTFDGDHAMAPGLFENPENNINCRCWLSYSK